MVSLVTGSKWVVDLHVMIYYKIRYKLKDQVKRIPDQINDQYLISVWI